MPPATAIATIVAPTMRSGGQRNARNHNTPPIKAVTAAPSKIERVPFRKNSAPPATLIAVQNARFASFVRTPG